LGGEVGGAGIGVDAVISIGHATDIALYFDVQGGVFLHDSCQFEQGIIGPREGDVPIAVEIDIAEDYVLANEVGGVFEYIPEGGWALIDGGIRVVHLR